MKHKRFIFAGLQILVGQAFVKDHALIVENKKILAIVPGKHLAQHLPATLCEFQSNHYLVPGFIDLHIHGAEGHDVMDGTENALRGVAGALVKEGVTGFLATTMTSSLDVLEKILLGISHHHASSHGAKILGIHLEGPFIAKSKAGAQDARYTKPPQVEWIKKWQGQLNGAIKIVTFAPELPSAFKLIETLCELNIIPSIGHTHANFEETLQALKAGASQATHLFNAMSGLHQREPGAAGAILLSEKAMAELIVDGIHVHPRMIALAFKIMSGKRLLLVSDAMRAKGLGDGDYELGGKLVRVKKGEAKCGNVLAGSTLQMPDAIKNMKQYTNCSLAEAVNMASFNPARVLGLAAKKGSIAVNKDADLVVMDDQFKILMTMREGAIVYENSAF